MSARNGITDQHAAEHEIAQYEASFADPGHGNSRAGWVSVIVMLVAITLGTLFFVLEMPALVWASAGLLLVGIILWPILKRFDHGSKDH